MYILCAARPLLVNFPNETYFKFELKRMREEKTAYLIHFLRLGKFFLHTGPCYIHKVQRNYYKLPRSSYKIFPSPVITSPYFSYTFSFYEGLANEK